MSRRFTEFRGISKTITPFEFLSALKSRLDIKPWQVHRFKAFYAIPSRNNTDFYTMLILISDEKTLNRNVKRTSNRLPWELEIRGAAIKIIPASCSKWSYSIKSTQNYGDNKTIVVLNPLGFDIFTVAAVLLDFHPCIENWVDAVYVNRSNFYITARSRHLATTIMKKLQGSHATWASTNVFLRTS
jgi:hypothetical protein